MTKGYHVKANKKSLGLRLPMYKTLYYTLSAIPFGGCALFFVNYASYLEFVLFFKPQNKTNCIFFV